eukprot:Polyplicarium_translucidae@DN3051_c3_g1_i1.p1
MGRSDAEKNPQVGSPREHLIAQRHRHRHRRGNCAEPTTSLRLSVLLRAVASVDCAQIRRRLFHGRAAMVVHDAEDQAVATSGCARKWRSCGPLLCCRSGTSEQARTVVQIDGDCAIPSTVASLAEAPFFAVAQAVERSHNVMQMSPSWCPLTPSDIPRSKFPTSPSITSLRPWSRGGQSPPRPLDEFFADSRVYRKVLLQQHGGPTSLAGSAGESTA